jgi:hypothetical protein
MELLIALLVGYFVPTIIALARGHKFATPIMIINIFLGWTLVGWVGALAWAAAPFTPAELPILELKHYPRLPPLLRGNQKG